MKYSVFIFTLLIIVASFLPITTYAACIPGNLNAPTAPPSDFKDFVCHATNFIGILLPFVSTVAVLVFFWGIAKFINSAGDEKKVQDGKKFLFWGVIILFVMFSIWGFLQFFSNSLFGPGPIGLPLLPTSTP